MLRSGAAFMATENLHRNTLHVQNTGANTQWWSAAVRNAFCEYQFITKKFQ